MKEFFGLGFVLLLISTIPAYITHIGWTLWMLLISERSVEVKHGIIMIIGILFPPFGALHGFTLWF